jgi:SAM-dependent methyltransferase
MSLLRLLEYEAIEGLQLSGITLDVGGGKASHYYRQMSIQRDIHAVNIDLDIGPTYLADLNQGIPVASDSYDNIISLNTLEHIWNDTLVLQEMVRVLKPGGKLYVSVPFLYRVHASPSDYHRHTAHFWEGMLHQVGFRGNSIEVTPLAFGPFAAPLSLVEFGFPILIRKLLRAVILSLPILRRKLRPGSAINNSAEAPLGFLVHAHK